MKKILSVVLVLGMILAFTGCAGKEYSCETLFENEEGTTEISVLFDLDDDGQDDEISVVLEDDGHVSVSALGKSAYLGYGDIYYIYGVYGLDMETKDGKKEIAVITEECSSDVYVRFLRYSSDMLYNLAYEGVNDFIGDVFYSDAIYIGYDAKITMNEKNTIKTSKRGNYGMWCVNAEYVHDGEFFKEIKEPVRDVVLSSYDYGENFSYDEAAEDFKESGRILEESEIENLKEGYVVAHADFITEAKTCAYGDVTDLKKGDIFKITKETDDGFIYIEKKEGKSGYIYMGDFSDNRQEVSPLAFFLAD